MDRNIAAGPAGQAPQRFSRLGRALAWAGIAAAGLGLLWLLGDRRASGYPKVTLHEDLAHWWS